MVIIGAKGHAAEVYQCLMKHEYAQLAFYDDVDNNMLNVFDTFPIYRNHLEVKRHFLVDSRYVLGLGGPSLRRKMTHIFDNIGGVITSVIANTAVVSAQARIGKGLNIMHHCLIAPNTLIGDGVLVNAGASVHHDAVVGDYCEISPGARLLGRCNVGNNTLIGSSAVILPDIIVGSNSIIGAGAIVTRDVDPYSKVVGNPARTI